MSTRKEKAQKASEEREKRSYKLNPIQGDSIGDRMVGEQLGKPAGLSVSNVKTSGNTIDDKAIAMSQLGNPAELPNLEKRQTFSDMLAPMRKAARQDKTDALKMQKYYALADVFNALGKMGGAAVGGAIGGNMLDSAPTVGEYKESRGYLDAFERAKLANERLRELDAKEFQLAYDQRKRDEERAYSKKAIQDERAYDDMVRAAERKYQAEQKELERQYQQAMYDKDTATQAEIKEKMATLEHSFNKEILSIEASYAAADDKRSLEYLKQQYNLYNPPQPVMFYDGSSVDMTDQQYERMKQNYIGKTVGGVKITKDNFDEFLRSHPKEFESYLKRIGATSSEQTKVNKPSTKIDPALYSYNQRFGILPDTSIPQNGNQSKDDDLGVEWEQ